jgi:Tol biopolymer transport system component
MRSARRLKGGAGRPLAPWIIAKDVKTRGGVRKDLTIRTLHLPTLLIAAAVAVACAVALSAVSEKAEAAFPGKNGRIAFAFNGRGPGSAWQIVTINPDGTDEKRLTHSSEPVYNISPSYSPDGTKITWQRNGNIWVMDADGTGQERLTSGPADDITPAFSPDGRKVTFSRSRPGEDVGIWVKKLKGGKDAKRVTAKNDGYDEVGPVFRPDGGRIAFARAKSRPGCADCIVESELATVRPDGTGLRVMTDTPSADPNSPDWSPNGRKLVFVLSAGLVGPVRIQTIKADGTKRRTVVAPSRRFLSFGPVFSPDGKKVAFEREGDKGDPDVWVMGADGTNPTDVTPIPKRSRWRMESEPDWGPRPATKR